MKDLACASRPSSLRTCTQVSSPWTTGCDLSLCFSASYSRSKCRSTDRITQLPSAPRLMLTFARASACSKRYKGVPSTYLLASTSASVDDVAMLPGKGCAGIGAITIGVCSAVRSQWRQAYLNRTCCNTAAFTSICSCSLTVSPIRCIRFRQHGHAFWSSGRSCSTRSRGRSSGNGLRPRCFGSGFSASGNPVSHNGSRLDVIGCLALRGGLLGFVEDTPRQLLAAWRIAMQALQAQLFLKMHDALRELLVLDLQRSDLGCVRRDERLQRLGRAVRFIESLNRNPPTLSRTIGALQQPCCPDGQPMLRYCRAGCRRTASMSMPSSNQCNCSVDSLTTACCCLRGQAKRSASSRFIISQNPERS